MTAEVAILNKSAVALAADSAVTINNPKGEKIYNTAIKLFNLNKRHPVGIMIYNNSVFVNTPWETIIKAYRSYIRDEIKDTIYEQAIDFIDYIKNSKNIFTEEDILNSNKENEIEAILTIIKINIENKIDEITRNGEDANIPQIIDDQIEFQKNYFISFKYYDNFSENNLKDFFNKNKWIFGRIKNNIFQKISFSKKNLVDLVKIVFDFIYKNHKFLQTKTGIVITGFGNNEFLPSLVDFEIKTFLDGILLYKIINNDVRVSGCSIRPYAQPEMVHTFIQGINPKLLNDAYSVLNRLFQKISNDFNLIPQLINLDDNIKTELIENVKRFHKENFKLFGDEFNNIIRKNYTNPVLNSVESLPKEELASVAESLIYLTFLRKRMSEEPETVGGAIDVAIISKGDGFIWIKRKHYFNQELNPHFFKNYFK
jgi:hypothetical protein